MVKDLDPIVIIPPSEKAKSVSCRATRPYLLALKEVARRKKKNIASLVREALDKEYGREIGELLPFFEKSEQILGQSSN